MGTIAKSKLLVRSVNQPDETRAFARLGHADILNLEDGGSVMHGIYEPGWRWSKDVQPIVHTTSCQAPHLGYVLRGKMVVKSDAGDEIEIGPGDVFRIPPGHDAWVVGDEACEMVDFGGYASYAKATTAPASTGSSAGSRPSVPRK